jgi:uncharacterized protein
MSTTLTIDIDKVGSFCRNKHIRRLSLFGSALHGEFTPESDLDLLVEFQPGHARGYFRLSAMERELGTIFGRKVDLRTAEELNLRFRDDVVRSAWESMRRDEERLRDMLDAARGYVALLGDRSVVDLRSNGTFSLALVRLIEIVGESANAISGPTQNSLPHIPWADAIATRNRLIYGYFSVDVEIVFDTIRDDFPPLIAALERALG